MKTPITPSSLKVWRLGRKLLPAMLVALFGLGAYDTSAQTYTVGTGTSQWSQYSTQAPPLGFYYPTSRTQYIYTRAELVAAGFTAGTSTTIQQIAFNIGSIPSGVQAAPNYNIRLGHLTNADSTFTSGSVSPAGFRSTAGMTLVYSNAAGYNYTTGWNIITFNVATSFTWNGTDNIIIDICHSQGNTNYSSAYCPGVYYNTKSGSAIYYNSSSAASACGLTGLSASATSQRPNVQFVHLVPCAGKPAGGTLSPSGTVTTACPGTSVNLVASGYGPALSTQYTWQTAASATGPWTNASAPGGVGNDRFTTPPLVSATYYRFRSICLTTNDTSYSPVTGFTFSSGPTYGSLPYFESFESWGNGCANSDKISSGNWTNIPASGLGSWRRNDQFATQGTTTYTYNAPAAPIHGSYMARWVSYQAPIGDAGQGTLNLYLDFSKQLGNKDLDFYFYWAYPSSSTAYAGDSLNVEMSTDGGATFAAIPGGQFGYANMIGKFQKWNYVQLKGLVSNSATTVIRFRSKHAYQYGYDQYLDAVRVIPPCAGKPVAGKIDSVRVCSGKPFKLSLTGTSQSAGLDYKWQYLPSGATTWADLPGGNVDKPTATITTPTSFRAIVTCTNVSPTLDDTSAVFSATLAPFYFCYCDAPTAVQYNYGYGKVGNVKITNVSTGNILLDNGNPLPAVYNTNDNNSAYYNSYSGKAGIPVPRLIRDTTYRFATTFVASGSYLYTGTSYFPMAVFIDYNRDGVFNTTNEKLYEKFAASQSSNVVASNITIPSNAQIGLTGMRIFTGYINATPPTVNPCGAMYYDGEVEDYLVYIEYPPCAGPVNPGTASASDTAICPGYAIDLYDTSYEKTRTGIFRDWQLSVNGGASWANIPGSTNRDTMSNVIVTTGSQYRLRVRCSITGDTTYSNVVSVSTPIPVRCYPVSQPALGAADSSDIGAFILGGFVNPGPMVTAGPHLMNPQAKKRRTDYTLITPIELIADSTYRLAIFHTMPRGNHADAMVSVFMDYNNDMDYDLNVSGPPFTSELVYQGTTSATNFFLDTKITIPNAVIANVPTGMRVVINNDTNPSGAGNTGSGSFTSGEVEDYIVIFRRTPLGVGNTGLLQNLALYPNPTDGKFTVVSDATRTVSHMDVVVTTITGQQVISRSFDNVGTHFSTNLDLSTQAKGVYFVEIRADGEKINKKLIVR